jgi:hypothetical protein
LFRLPWVVIEAMLVFTVKAMTKSSLDGYCGFRPWQPPGVA